MVTTEDWIAIATIVAGTGAAIAAVFLGYWLQLRSMRRARFAKLAASALANSYQLIQMGQLLATAYKARKLMDGWSETPSFEQVKSVVQPLMVVRMGLGVSSAQLLAWADAALPQPKEPQVRMTVAEDIERATRALDHEIETSRRKSMAMSLTGFAPWAKNMVWDFGEEVYGAAIKSGQKDGLSPEMLVATYEPKLNKIEAKLKKVTK